MLNCAQSARCQADSIWRLGSALPALKLSPIYWQSTRQSTGAPQSALRSQDSLQCACAVFVGGADNVDARSQDVDTGAHV